MNMLRNMLLVLGLAACGAQAQEKASDSRDRVIEQVMAHPLFDTAYACSEHPAGALPYLGDDLGQDCMVQAFMEVDGHAFMRAYRGDGKENADWYGWNHDVLSPCDCTVLRTHENPVVNVPGKTGRPPASFILLRAEDGTFFMVAHVQAVAVTQGEALKAGQAIAKVGNNGFARMPHIHIGAWRGRDALQIRWDQRQMPIDPPPTMTTPSEETTP